MGWSVNHIYTNKVLFVSYILPKYVIISTYQKVSKYDQEMPQSHIIDQPMSCHHEE